MSTSSKKSPRGDYKVGYARPPVPTRWLPGQSGNPKGRVPAESLNMLECLARALKHKVDRPIDTRNMTAMQAVFYKLVTEAAKGSPTALRELFKIMNFGEALDQRETVISAKLVFEEEENRLIKLSEENSNQRAMIENLKAQIAALQAGK